MKADTRDASAIMVASQMVRQPTLVRAVREAPLPKGVTLLLEVTARDAAALAVAADLTGEPPSVLADAAGFFVEQVLFTEHADYYRILGASMEASTMELRHHMALLMRWLHPDASAVRPLGQVDRSVFATRVTTAWQTLKSADRRAAYDAALRSTHDKASRQSRRSSRLHRRPRLSLRRLSGEGFLGRLLLFLQGHR